MEARQEERTRPAGRGWTIAGFVLAALGVVLAPFVIPSLVGAILGYVGYRKGDRLGKYAMWTSIVVMVFALVVGALLVGDVSG